MGFQVQCFLLYLLKFDTALLPNPLRLLAPTVGGKQGDLPQFILQTYFDIYEKNVDIINSDWICL